MKVILFDIDGVLLDSAHFIGYVVRSAFAHFGVTNVSYELFFEAIKKNNLSAICKEYLPHITEEEYYTIDHALQLENLHLCKPFAESHDVLRTLKDAGIKLATVTNRPAKTIRPSLDAHNISGYFDAIVSIEDVARGKPHPDLIIAALDRLGEEVSSACIIGDTAIDIIAGRNAGIQTVGVTYGFDGPAIADQNPDYVIASLAELPALMGIFVKENIHAI